MDKHNEITNDRFIVENATKKEICKELSNELNLSTEDAELLASFLSESTFSQTANYSKKSTCTALPIIGTVTAGTGLGAAAAGVTAAGATVGAAAVAAAVGTAAAGAATAGAAAVGIAAAGAAAVGSSVASTKSFSIGKNLYLGRYSINISKTTLSLLSCLLGFTPLNVISNIFSIGDMLNSIKESITKYTEQEQVLWAFLRNQDKEIQADLKISELRQMFENYAKSTSFVSNKEELYSLLDSLADKGAIEIRMERIIVH